MGIIASIRGVHDASSPYGRRMVELGLVWIILWGKKGFCRVGRGCVWCGGR
uniref:Uncharacterized protein n=1 Tax=Octopus bimaculoides TaxID=37653 RepID=A0A0L8FZQ3_OCTBM